MKHRSSILAVAALLFLAWDASAQVQAQARSVRCTGGEPKAVESFGSVERTRLLKQVERGRKADDVMRLGSVERRAILTGASVRMPLPQSAEHKRSYHRISGRQHRR